jgi:hypothetical protein
MHTIVNFEHLNLATPDALKAVAGSDAMKITIQHVRVRFRKFKDAFEASLQGFSLAGFEHLSEDSQYA